MKSVVSKNGSIVLQSIASECTRGVLAGMNWSLQTYIKRKDAERE
jgi:hypothetical protein